MTDPNLPPAILAGPYLRVLQDFMAHCWTAKRRTSMRSACQACFLPEIKGSLALPDPVHVSEGVDEINSYKRVC